MLHHEWSGHASEVAHDVRLPPDSDLTADMAGGPVRADFVAKAG